MKAKRSCVILAGVLIVLCTVLFLGQSPVFSEYCQIIRITEEKGGAGTRIEIHPQKITVSVDTCVVWLNWVTSDRVTVSFRENAKQCKLSTDATGFNLAPGEECYYAEFLSMGRTASMYFKEPGVYKYHLEMPGKNDSGSIGPIRTKIEAEGIIEVVKAE
jgi:hypothetical protein